MIMVAQKTTCVGCRQVASRSDADAVILGHSWMGVRYCVCPQCWQLAWAVLAGCVESVLRAPSLSVKIADEDIFA